MNSKIDAFLRGAKKWQAEMEKLRAILLDTPLTEEMKWGKPCYSLRGGNVVIIQGFKEYCALLFCKGALLKDPQGILIQQTENVQAARQIRFTSLQEIVKLQPALKAYIKQAIDIEEAGLEVVYKTISDYEVPDELQRKLDEIPSLKAAFAALTPGRQRGYYLYFAGAKQAKTREARVEKSIPQILQGKGLDD